MEPPAPREHRMTGSLVSWIGLGADLLLAVGKVIIGLLFSSQALLADGLHSGSDLVTDVAVLAGLKVSRKPADTHHPYGHRRVSTLVAMFVGVGLILAAAYIVYAAITSIQSPAKEHVRPTWPLAMAIFGIPVKEVLFRITRLAGLREEDSSLVANAWHHRTDAFSSVAAAAGLAGVLIGGPDWAFLDAVTATVLGTFLLVVAAGILRDAAGELIDRAPSATVRRKMRQAILATPGVRDFHALRARRSGGKIVADVHVLVDPALSVHAGHEIARAVRERIFADDPDVLEVIIHVEPYQPAPDGNDSAPAVNAESGD
jgi:cation diffusion facilitator family transporter